VLLLVSLIAGALSAGMEMGTRIWERSEARIAASQSTNSAQTVLRGFFAAALPRTEDGLVRFDGEPDRVAFDMPPPRAFAAAGLVRAEVSLVPTIGGRELRVKLTSLTNTSESREAVLARGLGAVRLAYLDASGKALAWLEFWRDRPKLPSAVRLTDDNGAPSSWPAFVARLQVAQPGLCAFDPVSTECRNP
jgi:hypothetical protein